MILLRVMRACPYVTPSTPSLVEAPLCSCDSGRSRSVVLVAFICKLLLLITVYTVEIAN